MNKTQDLDILTLGMSNPLAFEDKRALVVGATKRVREMAMPTLLLPIKTVAP